MKITLVLSLIAALPAAGAEKEAKDGRCYELRVYHSPPGKLDALHARFRSHTLKLFEKHGMANLAYWVPLEGEPRLIYILGYPDRAAREASWKAFLADPDWKRVQRESEKDGPLVARIESRILKAVDYSPEIKVPPAGEKRIFELRTYRAAPGKLPALHARFRDHTVALFTKHGMSHLGYWEEEKKDGAPDTLIYVLVHQDREAARKSFEAFRADPAWVEAKKKSETEGSLTEKVESVLLEATDYSPVARPRTAGIEVREDGEEIRIATSHLEAAVRKRGYVSGVAGGSFLDRTTGFRDAGFGLDIVDWIMEPGSDEAYRMDLPGDLPYQFGNLYHGKIPKRSIEGPQICTQARELSPRVTRGPGFVAVEMEYRYRIAAPGKKAGSRWKQTLVFPEGKRWFISADRIESVNAGEALFLRLDMPGHIRHRKGDTFSEIYLSYLEERGGRIPAAEFAADFPPDARFLYRREEGKVPRRFIRAYRLRDPRTGRDGPWLAGMTLDASAVHEAWCHQRGYVCLIEEIGGRPVKEGGTFGAAFLVGYFDDLEEMHRVHDEHAGGVDLEADEKGWRLKKGPAPGA